MKTDSNILSDIEESFELSYGNNEVEGKKEQQQLENHLSN